MERMEETLEHLRSEEGTLRTAAEIAGVDYVEMVELAAAAGVEVEYSTADLERDLDRI